MLRQESWAAAPLSVCVCVCVECISLFLFRRKEIVRVPRNMRPWCETGVGGRSHGPCVCEHTGRPISACAMFHLPTTTSSCMAGESCAATVSHVLVLSSTLSSVV